MAVFVKFSLYLINYRINSLLGLLSLLPPFPVSAVSDVLPVCGALGVFSRWVSLWISAFAGGVCAPWGFSAFAAWLAMFRKISRGRKHSGQDGASLLVVVLIACGSPPASG